MSEQKKYEKKVVSGRISMSLWKFATKYGDRERICVQHSRKDRRTGEWRNQQIWLNLDEIRDLAQAMEDFNGAEEAPDIEDINAGDESPASSVRAHCIIEFIKANSLDAGLDVYDFEELRVQEVLREYGISAKLTPGEETIIRQELRAMIEQREFAEMARMAHKGNLDIGYSTGSIPHE